MYIGQASKRSGATVKAIRLYEELGLLANIHRENLYRIFTEEDVFLIRFIKIAQKFDFKLSELDDVIYPQGNLANWENIMKAISLKEQTITKEIARLQTHQKDLNNYSHEIKQCLADHSDCTFPQVQSET